MVSESIIRKRLERLETSSKRLENKRNVSLSDFLKNWEIQDVVLREFQVAIESMIDIANHIISEKGWRTPESYQDVVKILAENEVIPEDYASILSRIIAFRNIIVHEYLYIDLEKVYKNLQRLKDLRTFSIYVEHFIESNKKRGG